MSLIHFKRYKKLFKIWYKENFNLILFLSTEAVGIYFSRYMYMYITCKQKRCNNVIVCSDTWSQPCGTCCVYVCRCLHFPHGRKSFTKSCLTSATYFWHQRRGSRCLSSTSRSGPKRRGGKNIENSAKRKTRSVNFLRRPNSMESKYLMMWFGVRNGELSC